MEKVLLIVILCNLCDISEVLGQIHRKTRETDQGIHRFGSRFRSGAIFGRNSPLNGSIYKDSPDKKPHTEINYHARNNTAAKSNKSASSHWRVLTETRPSPSDPGCLFSGVGCLRKVRRKKMENLANDTVMEKRIGYHNTRDINVSGDVLMRDRGNHIIMNDTKSSSDIDKFTTKIESDSCACYWRQERCGCDCEGSLTYDDFQVRFQSASYLTINGLIYPYFSNY